VDSVERSVKGSARMPQAAIDPDRCIATLPQKEELGATEESTFISSLIPKPKLQDPKFEFLDLRFEVCSLKL